MSKFTRKFMSLLLTVFLISSTSNLLVFANSQENHFKPVESNVFTYTNENVTVDDVVEFSNKLDLPIEISKDDVIVTKNLDGSDKYIVPYNKTYQKIRFSGINEMMESIEDSDIISNINLQDNILSYTLFDDIDVTIKETNENGVTRLDIIEGDKSATLEYNPANGDVFLNGSPVKYSITEAYVFEKNISTSAEDGWIYYDTMYPNIEAEDQIRRLPLSVLATLLVGGLNLKYALAVEIAEVVIDTLVDIGSPTEILYCERDIYRPETGYYAFKYYDDIYADSDYTELLSSNVWIQYE